MTDPDLYLSKNFFLSEFLKTSAPYSNRPSGIEIARLRELCQDILQPARNHFKVPIVITSGYRSPEVNYWLSIGKGGGKVSKSSQHLLGQAADLYPRDRSITFQVYWWMLTHLEFGQLIYYVEDKHIHVSTGKKCQPMYYKRGKLYTVKNLLKKEWRLK